MFHILFTIKFMHFNDADQFEYINLSYEVQHDGLIAFNMET